MGIADDIKPRKYRRIVERIEKKQPQEAVTTEDFFFSPQLSDDDFFAGTPIADKNQRSEKNFLVQKQEDRQSQKHPWLYTTLIVITIVILCGVIFWQNYPSIKKLLNHNYQEEYDQSLEDIINSKISNESNSINTQPTEQRNSPDSAEQASTQPVIDKSTISISVLNGSGVKLAAKNIADFLKTDGFEIKYIGNAKSFNYQNTMIYYHSGKEEEANLVKLTLDKKFQTVLENNDSVTGNLYDLVVVAGKK